MTTTGAWVTIITAVIAGLAGFAALIKTFMERPKYRADAMTLVTNAATEQMKTIREDNVDVRARLAAVEVRQDATTKLLEETEDKLDFAERQNRTLARQNKALMAHIVRMHDWFNAYYQAGHPPGMLPPPQMPQFDDTI